MIKFYSKVKKIEHRNRIVRTWMEGEKICSQEEDMGWFMLLEGSWEALYVGETQPEGLQVGDEVEVYIKRKEKSYE